jgi:tetratricopeptide (TPR) repeat protein
LLLFILGIAIAVPCAAIAAPLKTDLSATASDGYARFVFSASNDIDATARLSGNVLIITFKQPVAVSVDRIASQLPDYVGAARSDPDGKGIRVALARQVTLNAIAAGKKFFVDLLPDSWTGLPPSLPQDVIDDLARRAREADQLIARAHLQEKKIPLVRVRVATQPTFTRYSFDVPDQTSVSADRAKDRLVLNFDTPIRFDLADAQAALPATVGGISSELEDVSAKVRFLFTARPDVRTFRDEKGYVVDIVAPDAKSEAPNLLPGPMPGLVPAAQGQRSAAPETGPKTAAGDAVNPLPVGPGKPQVEAPATIPAQAPQPPVEASPAPAAPASEKRVEAPMPAAPAPTPPPVAPPAVKLAESPAPPTPEPQPAVAPPAPQAMTQPVAQRAAPAAPPSEKAEAPVPDAKNPPAAAAAAPDAAAAHGAAHTDGKASGKIAVDLVRDGTSLKLSFPFSAPVAGAIFHRADTLWLVFDTQADIDLTALDGEPSHTVLGYELTRTADADIVRIKLNRPQLASVASEGSVWTVEIGEAILGPTRSLDITRNLVGPNRSTVTIPFDEPHLVHHVADPDVGDQLLVVTGFAPARGFVHNQNFIEFRALASTQGVVVEPLADDVRVELTPDKIVVSRPAGLTLSTSLQPLLQGNGLRSVMFNAQIWGADRQATYVERQSNLQAAAAAAPVGKRLAPRLDLARFYLARDMYPEAKGVLDVILADERPAAEDASAKVLRSVAEVMMNRPDDALKDLADPIVGDQHDAPLWRALAYARQGKWAPAREAFKSVEAAVDTLPIELQRVALKAEMRSAIEVGDFAGASNNLDDFQTIGVPHDMEPTLAVLIGRLAEGMGRTEDALSAYRTAADSWDRPAAAQGRLRETVLRYSLGDLKRSDVIAELETLTTIWRGDETEIEALKILAHLYTEDGRYRDAFYVMRSAMAAHPDSDMTRQIQQEAAATFDSLFLAGRGDAMPAIDALALFYDFRELTPIGRRGDEMIRRLADRLVSVDLLDQAADLLQYQVDHRLDGAARAQVATRLAVIYLINRKADRALATLRATRTADLSNDLRNQRLLLEGRALSDLGRHELALEVIANVDGREAIRLRSDIYWAARGWRESAEQIELMYGERWKSFEPLTDVERQDILRAEIGYALASDSLGMGRFREKYAAKMAETPDSHAFELVSQPLGSSSSEFGTIAHAAAAGDTLEGFLRDMKARYPEASTLPPDAPGGGPALSSQPPQTRPASPLPAPTPPPRAAGRTALR